ncbi:hypothetical protein EsDP_00005191 [Epichloe bromicola]|uniref:Uncharacterized protein n=1 Tax=Epichloe bromicola TaxID=79588 RepID=A0ABQ0CTX8_9HYPO
MDEDVVKSIEPATVQGHGRAGQWGETPTSDIASWVAGTWICERHGQEEDGLLATELDAYRMWNEEVLDKMESSQGLSDRVWRKLWPDRDGEWTANWHSFPLAEVEEDGIAHSVE